LCATAREAFKFGLHKLASLSTLLGHQYKLYFDAFMHSIYQSLPDHGHLLEMSNCVVVLVVDPTSILPSFQLPSFQIM